MGIEGKVRGGRCVLAVVVVVVVVRGDIPLHCSISGVHQSVRRHITVSLTNTYTHGLTLAI